MLRTLLIATTLLTASGTAFASSDYSDYYGYGRVVSVEPHFVISFGSQHHDGFRVLYESGGHHYWTHTPYRPGHTIVLPPRHRVQHVHHYRDHRHGWDGRHGWNDRGEHRRHDSDYRRDRDDRDDHREHRRHGRD